MSYIDGLASGLDTTSIITQLMQVEAIPKTLLEKKATTVQAGLDAYASIRTKVSAVRTAADAVAATTSWRPLTATSSNTDAVAVSAGTGTPGAAVSFTVVNLATAMQRSSSDTFASLDADLGGRTVSITRGAESFDSTATTLEELVAEINAATDLGVRASTLQVSPGQHRLVLTSADTGVDNGFSVSSSGWSSGFGVTRAAEDAELDVGGITVTRPSNTITDLVDGATLTLRAETDAPVTVTVARDAKALAAKVKALVEAMNGALGEIKLRTAYNAETNQRSSLTGDATARSLSQKLTSAFIDPVESSSLVSLGLAGVELKRDGTIAFDEAEFTAAYAADPAAVERLFVAGAAASSTHVTFNNAGWRAQPGTYAIEVTNTGGTYTATIDGTPADVTVTDDGIRVAVSGLHATLGGLSVNVATVGLPADGATADLGTVTYEPGAAKRLSSVANRALDLVDGELTTAEESRKNRIKDINRQVEAWERRLEKRELALRRQYTALESMMGQLANQGQWMAGQLAGLQANLSAS